LGVRGVMERKRYIRKSSGTTCRFGIRDKKPFFTKARGYRTGLFLAENGWFLSHKPSKKQAPSNGVLGVETLAISASAQMANPLCDVLVSLPPRPKNMHEILWRSLSEIERKNMRNNASRPSLTTNWRLMTEFVGFRPSWRFFRLFIGRTLKVAILHVQ